MTEGPAIVFCADDFTGASDTLATLSRAGLNTRLYLQPPSVEHNPEIAQLDAVGVATSLRAQDPAGGRRAMRAVGEYLAQLQAQYYHFKVCSTFDSSAATGNIAASSEVFAECVGARWTAIIGGQPALSRYCVFGHLFAAAGDESVYRIDRHPVMRQHPVTPMAESDLRRHLQAQGMGAIGLLRYTDYDKGVDDLVEKLHRRIVAGETHTLLDVSRQQDLVVISNLLRRLSERHRILCLGASSVAEALVQLKHNNVRRGERPVLDSGEGFALSKKPVLAVAGSRSSITAQQVTNATLFLKFALSPSAIQEGSEGFQALVERCVSELRGGQHLLLYLQSGISYDLSGDQLSAQLAAVVEQILAAGAAGLLTVAGGDTSSAVLQTLAPDSLSFKADFERGAPLIQAHSNNACLDELPMILKGGQMGSADFFNRAARLSQGGAGGMA